MSGESKVVWDEDDDGKSVDEFRAEILSTPAGRATYLDSQRRNAMLSGLGVVRKAQGLNQRQVADAMGTTQSAVSQIESGRADPQLRTLQKYARAIGLRLDVAVVDEALPAYDNGTANVLWDVVERMALSPILTSLATNTRDEDRSLGALASAARLSPDLVQPIMRSLEERGWVTSAGAADSATYSLRSDAAYTIGISLHRNKVVGVLVDLRGAEVEDATILITKTTRRTVVNVVVDLAGWLYDRRGNHEVLGVGVSLAGVVDVEKGQVTFAPDLTNHQDGWQNVDLESEIQLLLQDRVKDPHLLVAVENDANALAMSEYLRTGERCVVALLMSNSGSGIGLGVVVDGRVMYGQDHAAGEGGHVIVIPDGDPCRIGEHGGCLETVATASGILRKLGLADDSTEVVDKGLEALNARLQDSDNTVSSALLAAGEALGAFLSTAMILYNPSAVVIYGHRALVDVATASGQLFRQGVEDRLSGGVSKKLFDRLRWDVLQQLTEAGAAGAAAKHYFLEHPSHWRPSVVTPRAPDIATT